MQARETRFELPEVTLAAREWGGPDGLPFIALHGWLDNAASFDLLAPRLPGCRIVAVDAAGHGWSGSRSPDARYNLWHEVGDVVELADTLGWRRFSLLGHSRGAGAATLIAGAFPDRVEHLVLIEGGIPILADARDAPQTLADAIAQNRVLREKTGRVFADRATAVAERANGFSPISTAAAEILAARSLSEVAGGFRWHADQRLKAKSELRLTPEQMRAFTGRVTARALAFLASESPFAHRPEYRGMLASIPGVEIVDLEGRHHMHMEGAEDVIAARVAEFLAAGSAVRTS